MKSGKHQKELILFLKINESEERLHQAQKNIGYDIVNKHYVVNESEAKNIVDLYKYFINVNGNINETYKYFIKHFNGKGQDALYKYLRETAYIGKYKLYRKEIYIDNYIPRIIDDELFYSVQNLLKKSEKKSSKTKILSIFTGIIYCNVCNCRMCRKQDTRSNIPKMRYICDNATRRKPGTMEYKCTNHKSVKESEIEEYLLENVKKIAKNYITKNVVDGDTKVKDNSKEIKNIERKMNKLKDLYLDDLIDKETYKNDYKKLTDQINDLKKTTDKTEARDFSNLQNFINMNLDSIYKKLNTEEKRTLWLNTINKIIIENGEIKEITFL